MWILIYLGPAFLVATLIFAFVLNNMEGAEISAIAWLVLTFVGGWVVFPRTVPEKVMVLGNDALFVLAIMAGLLGWI
jgi:hypothetical protein